MNKEYRHLKKMAKKILTKKDIGKIKKLKTYDEKTESLKYMITSKVKLKLLELETKAQEKKRKEVIQIDSNLIKLESKIKILESTHQERDLKVIQELIKKIESEINV